MNALWKAALWGLLTAIRPAFRLSIENGRFTGRSAGMSLRPAEKSWPMDGLSPLLLPMLMSMGEMECAGAGWHTFGSGPDDKSFYAAANGRDGCSMVPFSRAKRKSR